VEGDEVIPDPNLDAERLLTEAAELSRTASGFDAATPARVTGTDASGQVEIRLTLGGHPDQIRVSAAWARQLEPDRLGAAVVDAAEDAARTAARLPADRDRPQPRPATRWPVGRSATSRNWPKR
jgi:hypothetical protein